MTLPTWNEGQFGCVLRDEAQFQSLLRTQLSASLPAPFLSRKADTAAPVQLTFTIQLSSKQLRAWEQWYAYDLADGSLPFTMFLAWGTTQPHLRCRLIGNWQGQRLSSLQWRISGGIEIERESLPRFSGGAR